MTDPERERTSAGTSRGAKAAVGVVALLGILALYVALGGPLPFVAEGGPALESVPAEADVVVYTDAWTFSSETSRNVVDGLLTVSNESLPGYTGPASLGSAFEALSDTTLDPTGLRSVTAFGGYDTEGRVGQYQAMVLKTTWSRTQMQRAFGGSTTAYEQRQYGETTVYALADNETLLPWLARLEGDQFVIGTESAVKGAIDAHAGRDEGINDTLRERFDALDRGAVRFVATLPADLPGRTFLPDDVGRTIDGIETVGGLYYPEDDEATVEITIGTRDEQSAGTLQPAMQRALVTAGDYVPASTRALFEAATVSQSKTGVTVSMTGPVDAFLDGYRSLIENGLLDLLAGEPVGEPAVALVPADAQTVGYVDAGLVTDPVAQALFERLLSIESAATGTAADGVFRGLETVSVSELTSFRSVTVFGRGIDTNTTDAAAIIQARWSTEGIQSALEAANATYETDTHAGTAVFVVTEDDQQLWMASVTAQRQVLGTPSAVRDVLAVADGTEQPLSGSLATALENGTSYLRVASVVPRAATDAAGPLSNVVEDIEVIEASYDTIEDRVEGRITLHFESADSARTGRQVIVTLRSLGLGNLDDDRLVQLLESTDVRRDGRRVILSAQTDPETLLAVIDRVAAIADDGESAVVEPAGDRSGQAIFFTGAVPPGGERQ